MLKIGNKNCLKSQEKQQPSSNQIYIYTFSSFIDTECEYVQWFKLSKYLLKTDEDVSIGAVYIPPENRKYMKQDILDTEVEQFNTFQYVTLLGEFNARTADIEDICNIDDEVLNSVQIDADVVFHVNTNRELISKDISYKRVLQDKTSNR